MIDAIPAHLQPMPASVALLERAAGHRLALLSNMLRPVAPHLEATRACFGRFEHRTWSGRRGAVKPERAIFDAVRDALARTHKKRGAAYERFAWRRLSGQCLADVEHSPRA